MHPLQQLGEAAQHQIAHRVPPGVVDLLEAIEIQQHQHQAVGLPAVLFHRPADGLVEVGAIAEPGQVIESYLALQLSQSQIERQGEAKQPVILLQLPALAIPQGLFQLVLQLAEQLFVLAPQLEAIAVQHQSGLGGARDESVRLAAVEMERMDPDNACHPRGKDCQQGVKISLYQQLLELLIAILAAQGRKPLHLLYPLLYAMSEAVQ